MPSFVSTFLLPYVLPIVFQTLTPLAVEYIKVAVGFIEAKLPASVVLTLVAAVSEGVNQAQHALTGVALPPGAGAFIGVLLNEILADFNAQPPTPGVSK